LLDEQKQIESFDITAKAVGGKGERKLNSGCPTSLRFRRYESAIRSTHGA